MKTFQIFLLYLIRVLTNYFDRKKKPETREVKRMSSRSFIENTYGVMFGVLRYTKKPLQAPLSGRPCACYEIIIEKWKPGEKRQPGYWKKIHREIGGLDFYLEDSQGRAYVRMRRGNILLDKHAPIKPDAIFGASTPLKKYVAEYKKPFSLFSYKRTLRFREGILEDGEQVAVIGQGVYELDPAAPRAAPGLFLQWAESMPLHVGDSLDTIRYGKVKTYMPKRIIYQIMRTFLRLNRSVLELYFWTEQSRRKITSVILKLLQSTAKDMQSEETTLGGRRAMMVGSKQNTSKGVLLFFHGGDFPFMSPRNHRNMLYEVTKATNLQGYAVDYKLTPEDCFPRGLNDSVAAYQELLSRGIKPENIVLGGDFAGGGMTLAVLLKLRDDGIALPSAAFCFSPWTDLTLSGESHRNNRWKDPVLAIRTLRNRAKNYGGTALENPLVSPLFGDYAGLPPIMIHVGEDEILLDDTLRLGAIAKAKGWNIQVKQWPRMPHAFQFFTGILPDSRRSIGEVAEFLEAVRENRKQR